MVEPSVSVVITSHNYGRYLRLSLDSVLSQAYPGAVEVIVVDDGSRDGSIDVLETYRNRVQIVAEPRRRGQAAGVNRGYALSTGEYVFFLDADDIWYEQKIERCVLALMTSGAGMVHHNFDVVDGAGECIKSKKLKNPARAGVRWSMVADGRAEVAPTSCLGFSRQALADVMPIPDAIFDTSFNRVDYYFSVTVLLRNDLVAVPDSLAAYRSHGENSYSGLRSVRVYGDEVQHIRAFGAWLERRQGIALPTETDYRAVRGEVYATRREAGWGAAFTMAMRFAIGSAKGAAVDLKWFLRVLHVVMIAVAPSVMDRIAAHSGASALGS